MKIIVKSKINRIHIKDALHVPKLHANLLSVSKFILYELKIQFNLNQYIVKSCSGEVIVITLREGSL